MRTMPRDQAQQPPASTNAERQARWRGRNRVLSNQRVAASHAKKPELYRALNRKAVTAYNARQREHAALVAAAAEVTALWARYAWHDTATFAEFEDAVARLDALLPEKPSCQ